MAIASAQKVVLVFWSILRALAMVFGKVTYNPSLDKQKYLVTLSQDVLHPPVNSWFMVYSKGLHILGHMGWMQFFQVC